MVQSDGQVGRWFNGEHARHVRQSGRLSSESVSGPRIGLSTGAVGRRFLPGNRGCVRVGDRPCPWQENRGKHPVSALCKNNFSNGDHVDEWCSSILARQGEA